MSTDDLFDDEFFEGLANEVEQYLKAETEVVRPDKTKYAIDHDTYDAMTWESAIRKSDSLLRMVRGVTQDYPLTGPALEDFFNLFFKTDPRMNMPEDMLKEYMMNFVLVGALFDSDEVSRLRRYTLLNEFASGEALEKMEETIREVLDELKALQDLLEQLRAAYQQALQDLADALQELKDAEASGADDLSPLAQALKEALDNAEAAKRALEEAEEQEQEALEDAADSLKGAAQEAADQAEEDEQNESRWGVGPAEHKRMSFDERKALKDRLRRDKVQAILRLLGNFKAVGKAARRRRVKHTPAEVFDYTLGDNLDMLVAEELNNLAVPELEELFWLRWAQHSLLVKEVRGPDNAGQGPIMVVCDESSSMGEAIDADRNTKEMWSKAFALALCEQARKEGRDFTYIGFCNAVEAEYHFPKGKGDFNQVVDFVEGFAYGGTSFEPALSRALELIQETEKRRQDRPDVVFLTDGEGPVSEEFAEEWQRTLRRLDAHCYAIQLGGSRPAASLNAITSDVMLINQFNANPETLSELFKHI